MEHFGLVVFKDLHLRIFQQVVSIENLVLLYYRVADLYHKIKVTKKKGLSIDWIFVLIATWFQDKIPEVVF